jgi:glycosyltransferase involved in cell wall biosynthesis
MRKKKVAVIGIKGLRIIYSGFETFVKHLVAKAPEGKIYYLLFVRDKYQREPKKTKNYELIIVPSFSNKYLETFSYSLFSTLKSLFLDIDNVLYLGVANTPFIWLQKLRKRKVIVNVDGLDWKRKRWPTLGKIYLKICERLTVIFADLLIADAKTIFDYYKKTYNLTNKKKGIVCITYGAKTKKRKAGRTLSQFHLKPGQYFFFLGRLVPENYPEELILAFQGLKTNFKCVIVGDTYYEDKYKKYLKSLAKKDKRVVFTGFLKGKKLEEICSNAYAYVETKTVGGTHPSLLEAMAYEKGIIAKKIKGHQEVLSNCAIYYSPQKPIDNLRKKLKYALDNPQKIKSLGKLAGVRVRKNYNWDKVISKYHKIFGSKKEK